MASYQDFDVSSLSTDNHSNSGQLEKFKAINNNRINQNIIKF